MPTRLLLVVFTLLSASPVLAQAAAEPPPEGAYRVLLLDLEDRGVNDADVVATISGLCAVTLSENKNLDVVTGADLKQLVKLEGEKQALGCSDDSSCLAEVAGAMGAEIVVFGQVGMLGKLLVLTLNVFDSTKAKSVGRVSVQAESLEELPDALRPQLRALVASALGDRLPAETASSSTAEAPAAAETAPRDDVQVLPWALAGSGGAVAVLGLAAAGYALFVPGAALLDAEQRFRAGDKSAADDGATWAGQYESGLVSGLFYGGTALAVVGAGVVVVGTALLFME